MPERHFHLHQLDMMHEEDRPSEVFILIQVTPGSDRDSTPFFVQASSLFELGRKCAEIAVNHYTGIDVEPNGETPDHQIIRVEDKVGGKRSMTPIEAEEEIAFWQGFEAGPTRYVDTGLENVTKLL